jgi:transcriptional regulator GlxA family with amidase domain
LWRGSVTATPPARRWFPCAPELFVLAETGLVDGLSVAAPQICAKELAKRFPKIIVDTNRRFIDHGDIITAGGFLSWVDLCLYLVERILGPTISAATARFALDSPAAREARYFSGFAPPLGHRDKAVLKAQEWAHMDTAFPLLCSRGRLGWVGARSSGDSREQRG